MEAINPIETMQGIHKDIICAHSFLSGRFLLMVLVLIPGVPSGQGPEWGMKLEVALL